MTSAWFHLASTKTWANSLSRLHNSWSSWSHKMTRQCSAMRGAGEAKLHWTTCSKPVRYLTEIALCPVTHLLGLWKDVKLLYFDIDCMTPCWVPMTVNMYWLIDWLNNWTVDMHACLDALQYSYKGFETILIKFYRRTACDRAALIGAGMLMFASRVWKHQLVGYNRKRVQEVLTVILLANPHGVAAHRSIQSSHKSKCLQGSFVKSAAIHAAMVKILTSDVG